MTTWDEYIREMEQDLAERRKSLAVLSVAISIIVLLVLFDVVWP